METMGDRIKKRRMELGFTLADVAEKLGVESSTILRYENGHIENIKYTIMLKLADILYCTPSYLMGLESKEDSINAIYLSFAKDAQENGIDPEDIQAALNMIKSIKEKK